MSSSPTSSAQPYGVNNGSMAGGNTNAVASYTPDELAFHKLFPQVPLNEKLVESYQCGLSRKKIVRMGRLYLTSLRLCFHSTFLSNNLMLEWEHVDAVEKKENFVFEAIVVKVATGETHYFSAFMYGMTDQAHKMTTMLWNVRRKYANGGGAAVATGGRVVVHQRTESTASLGSGVGSPQHGDSSRNKSLDAGGREGPLSDNADTANIDGGAGGVGAAVPTESTGADAVSDGSPVVAAGHVDDATPPQLGETAQQQADHRAATPPMSGTPENVSMTYSPRMAEKKLAPVLAAAPGAQLSLGMGAKSPTLSPSFGSEGKLESGPSNPAGGSPQLESPTLGPVGPLGGRASGAGSPAPLIEGATGRPQSPQKRPSSPPPPSAPVAATLTPPPAPVAHNSHHQQHAAGGSSGPAATKSERRAEKAIARSSVVPDAPHDVLRYFPQVPKSETVVDSFQCSYVVGVHRLGKLYITANYILFTSVMLADGVCVKFSDIKSIEKEQTMVILDGVAIATRNGATHAFTSFVNRDSAFSILQHFFGAHCSKNATRERLKHQNEERAAEAAQAAGAVEAAGLEGSLASPTLGATDASGAGRKRLASGDGTAGGKLLAAPKEKEPPKEADSFRTQLIKPSFAAMPAATSIDEFSKVQTDFGTGLSDTSNFMAKQIIPEVKFQDGVTIMDVFKYMFDDDTTLLDAYHAQRQDTGCVWEQWRAPVAGSPGMSGQRKMTCTTVIRAVMAKQCPFTEFQRFGFLNVNGSPHLLVQLSGQAIGVMFSDSFRAETLLVFSQPSVDSAHVTLKVYGYIQFLRSVWVRGKILSTALDVEMPECYRTLSTMGLTKLAVAPRMHITDHAEAGGDEEPVPCTPVAAAPAVATVEAIAAPAAAVAAPAPVPAASAAATAAMVHPPATPLWAAHVACCSLGLFYVLCGIWSTFWLHRSVAIAAFAPPSSPLPGASLPDGQPMPPVGSNIQHVVDMGWLVDVLRPLAMSCQCLLAVVLSARLERLLNAA